MCSRLETTLRGDPIYYKKAPNSWCQHVSRKIPCCGIGEAQLKHVHLSKKAPNFRATPMLVNFSFDLRNGNIRYEWSIEFPTVKITFINEKITLFLDGVTSPRRSRVFQNSSENDSLGEFEKITVSSNILVSLQSKIINPGEITNCRAAASTSIPQGQKCYLEHSPVRPPLFLSGSSTVLCYVHDRNQLT